MSREELVTVCRHPGDRQIAEVPLSDLWNFHMRGISGGAIVSAGQDSLYARMSCASIPEGVVFSHSCEHGPPPHEILVCITQSGNDRVLYRRLRRQLDPEWGKRYKRIPEEVAAARKERERRRAEAEAYVAGLDLREVAQKLHVTVPTVRAYIKRGKLKAMKLDSTFCYLVRKHRSDDDRREFRGYRVSRAEVSAFGQS